MAPSHCKGDGGELSAFIQPIRGGFLFHHHLLVLLLPPQFFAPFELIKYNVEKEEPVRDARGLCIPVGPGTMGLDLGRWEGDGAAAKPPRGP